MRVSVLIPCYNAAAYLGEAIDSVLAQGIDLHEIVVVDDGSTDGSADAVQTYRDHVLYHRQPNGGISRARNEALALATGDVIAFLDADDLWPAESLAARLNALNGDESLGYVFGLVEQFVSPQTPAALAERHAAQITAPAPARLAGAMVIRRAVFDAVGGFDESVRVGETIDWISRADHLGIPNRALNRIVLRRRLHSSNTGLTQQASRTDYLAVARAALERRRNAAQS